MYWYLYLVPGMMTLAGHGTHITHELICRVIACIAGWTDLVSKKTVEEPNKERNIEDF